MNIFDLDILKKYKPVPIEQADRCHFTVGPYQVDAFSATISKDNVLSVELVIFGENGVVGRDIVYPQRQSSNVRFLRDLDVENKGEFKEFLFELAHSFHKKQETAQKRNIPNWKELMDMPHTEPQWIIKPIIAVGDVVLLSGPGKAGKTILLNEAAISLALGQPWLGQFEVCVPSPAKSLYLDFEMGRRHLVGRGRVYEKTAPKALSYIKIDFLKLPLTTKGGMKTLEAMIQEYDPTIVFVDNLSPILGLGGIDDNDATAIRALFFTPAKDLANRYNCGIWVIDHWGKTESRGTRGSAAKEQAADTVVYFQRVKGSKTESILSFPAARDTTEDIQGREFTCIYSPFTQREYTQEALEQMNPLDRAKMGFTEEIKPAEEEKGFGPELQKAQEFVKENPEATLREISEAAGKGKDTVARWRREGLI